MIQQLFFSVLDNLGISHAKNDVVSENEYYCDPHTAKILIIGGSGTKKNHIEGMLKDLGFSSYSIKKRFDIVLEYDLKNYNFCRINKTDYAAILMGATPHSGKEKGDNSSILTSLEKNHDYYPPVIRLESNSGLKVTKSNIEKAVRDLIESGKIIVN